MISSTNEDHRKFVYALIGRDIRRLAAVVDRINIPVGARNGIDCALDQLEARVFLLAFADDASGRTLVVDVDRYSDGRPVTTTVDWGRVSPPWCPAPIRRTVLAAPRERNSPRRGGPLAQRPPPQTKTSPIPPRTKGSDEAKPIGVV
jgi:hypothetical protein